MRLKALPYKLLNMQICLYTNTYIHSYSDNAIHNYIPKGRGNDEK
jgi:hypothetical protein